MFKTQKVTEDLDRELVFEADKIIEERDKIREEKDKITEEKDKIINEKETLFKGMAKEMLKYGKSLEEIKHLTKFTDQQIQELKTEI